VYLPVCDCPTPCMLRARVLLDAVCAPAAAAAGAWSVACGCSEPAPTSRIDDCPATAAVLLCCTSSDSSWGVQGGGDAPQPTCSCASVDTVAGMMARIREAGFGCYQ
jgi:hypothetical protein